MEYKEKYKEWCNNQLFSEKEKEELESIKYNDEEIKDRFYKDLEFGTAGLRGIIGMGTNRMNNYTVGVATQGLANYIIKEQKQNRPVVISYDSRHMSKEFSREVALCLNGNGIKTYIFEELRPVPELSFTVRKLGAIAGIMITASHNPPEYNGYKVYWEDGAQIVAPKDMQIIEEVRKVKDFSEIKKMNQEEAIQNGYYNIIGKEIDKQYKEELKKLVLNPDIIRKVQKDVRIVYTPLHGTGIKIVPDLLKELGFENVYVVPEQEKPDGDFPTVSYPNPEDPKAFELALKLAKKVNADVVLATDPDADRLGVFSKDDKTGEYITYTGNMSALLIAEYELSQRKEKGILPGNGAMIKTVVSSNLADAIAREYKLKLIEVLTGFKYIGEQIKHFDMTKKYSYQFGFEESYGCLFGTYARDKDGIAAVMALCELTAYYKSQGKSLWSQMIEIYEKYGYYKESQVSIILKGADGAEKIQQIMKKLREDEPKDIDGRKILKIKDFQIDKIKDFVNKEETKTGLPRSNVLYYELENDEWCAIRPSGTEPKIKLYVGVKTNSMKDSEEALKKLTNYMKGRIEE